MDEHDFNAPTGRIDLRQLPVFSPDAALWSRLLAGQRRRRRVQHWKRCGASLAAVVFACAAIVLLPRLIY